MLLDSMEGEGDILFKETDTVPNLMASQACDKDRQQTNKINRKGIMIHDIKKMNIFL